MLLETNWLLTLHSKFNIMDAVKFCVLQWRIRLHLTKRASLVLVESYRQMVAQAAWRAWRSLPIQIRAWIEPDDMIADGIFHAYQTINRWDKDKGEFSTL